MTATTVTVPTLVIVLPLLLVVAGAYYLVARWFMNDVLDPRVQRWMRRRYEREMRAADATDEEIEAGWQRLQESL